MSRGLIRLALVAILALAGGPALAAGPAVHPRDLLASDIPAAFKADESGYDYLKRDVMIPMRDGVTLHTVIVIPKGEIGRAHV